MKHHLHILLSIFLLPFMAKAQSMYVRGQVKDETGMSLQNVSLLLHSTGYVYYSGLEGSFGIPSYKKADTLTVSLEGYLPQRVPISGAGPLDIRLQRSAIKKKTGYRLNTRTDKLKRETLQSWLTGDETYASLVENRWITASNYPTTAVSLNIDKASYSNIRRFLTAGEMVPPDAVRTEEVMNYFQSGYREPASGSFAMDALLSTCPWNKNTQLLFARIDGKKLNTASLPSSHLVFLVDVSASMDMPNRLPTLKAAFKSLVQTLRARDSVAIVVYGGTTGVVLPTTGGDQKERIMQVIDSLQASGSTPGESGIKLAYEVARRHYIPKGNNRIILATDGDFNVGLHTEEELEQLVHEQKDKGIYLTCLGIGMGNYKDSKIQTLAQWGNGNFAYIDSYAEAEKVLLKEFTQTLYAVADDAVLQCRFDPARIQEYRVIGFDNKMGAIRDTAAIMEGGEIGSAYSSLICFEITPKTEALPPDSPFVQFRLTYRDPGSSLTRDLLLTPSLQLNNFQQLRSSYRFATALIIFSSLLRQSVYAAEMNWNMLQQIAEAAADKTSLTQLEFLSLVQRAKLMYSKRKRKDSQN